MSKSQNGAHVPLCTSLSTPLVLRYCLDFKLAIFCAGWWALLAWHCWGTRTSPPKWMQRIPGASPNVALPLPPKWGLWWQIMVSLQPPAICCTDVPLCLRISALVPMCLRRSLFDDYGSSNVRTFGECREVADSGSLWKVSGENAEIT